MISRSTLDKQLKQINFNTHGWGRSEAGELSNVLIPGETVDECVNGFYEAGFALLVATIDRLLLVDKKPMHYLTVHDLRFDMINEFDYNHRIIGAEIRISAGAKTLHFTSWNQARLRRLLGFVQYRITEVKRIQQSHQEAQKAHLEQMSQQLQMFLAIQQYQYQQQHVRQQLDATPTPSQVLSNLTNMTMKPGGETTENPLLSPGQLGVAAMKRVVPVIGAYTRLPWMSRKRRFQSSVM